MSLEHQIPVVMKKTQMSGEHAQCGLTSLLPMSCRSRAEAFARRLHTRLRGLGSSSDDTGENSWLGAAAPPRPRSDLFFDFDLECESPSSTADEYDAPFRDHSPSDDTDAPFRDHSPSDDTDAPFYDLDQESVQPIKSQDAASPDTYNGDISPPPTDSFTFSAFYADRSPIKTQPAARENGYADSRLYSAITLDGCERCDYPHKPDVHEVDSAAFRFSPPITLHSCLPVQGGDSDSDFESAKSDLFEEVVVKELEHCHDEDTYLTSDRFSELSLHLEDIIDNKDHIEFEDKPVEIDGLHLETDPSSRVRLEIKTSETPTEKEMSPVPEQDPALLLAQVVLDEAETEERPQRVRRCSSLKTGKTPPGTPGRKKIVRFADVLGLDLADVKTFMDEIPVIPKSAYEDLANADVAIGSPPVHLGQQRPGGGSLSLVPLFQAQRDVTEALEARCVCLESARVADGTHIAVCGSVRVRNLDFHKTVHVRYTMDGWRTYTDLQATYVLGSCDGFSDRFTFVLYVPAISAGQRLELAVRFQCKGCQYWDNNFGANYCFDCLPLGVPAVVSLGPLHPTLDWHPSFY